MFELLAQTYNKLQTFVPVQPYQIKHYKEKYFRYIHPEFIKCVTDKDNKLIAFVIIMPSFTKALKKANINISDVDFLNLRNSISIKAINNFIGLPHRQEIIKSNKKIIIINDSKATNFESTLPALQNYKNIYWICGGIAKTKDISVVIPHLKNVRKVYVIGTTKNVFYDSFKEHIDTVYVKYLSKAISEALKDSKKNKNKVTILFSPAAASFDQYKNFETRGNAYIISY